MIPKCLKKVFFVFLFEYLVNAIIALLWGIIAWRFLLLAKQTPTFSLRGHLKTYTVISFHNLYHQPPQLIPISIHNLYHFEGSASTSTTYTINWHQSGITYTIPEISIAELIPILID